MINLVLAFVISSKATIFLFKYFELLLHVEKRLFFSKNLILIRYYNNFNSKLRFVYFHVIHICRAIKLFPFFIIAFTP